MITVVSLKEFEALIKDKVIKKSENTLFIDNKELRDLIMSQITEVVGDSALGGFITVLCGVETELNNTMLRNHSNEIILKLPRPNDPVYLSLPDSLCGVRISSSALRALIPMDLSDEQISSLAKEMFEPGVNSGVQYDYAFLNEIRLSSVSNVIYDSSVEDRLKKIQEKVKQENLVFTKTDLFAGR